MLGDIGNDAEAVIAEHPGQLEPVPMALCCIAGAIQKRETQLGINFGQCVAGLQHQDMDEGRWIVLAVGQLFDAAADPVMRAYGLRLRTSSPRPS